MPLARVAGVSARSELLELIKDLAVVHGRVTLSSGREADYYVDLRRVTLHHGAAPLIGAVMLDLTADWTYDAVGGLTLGADPVATAMMHASGGRLDAFVVRKSEKQHGLQRRIEGPRVAGRRVLAVEDTSTTGGSVLTAVEALQPRAPSRRSRRHRRSRRRRRGAGRRPGVPRRVLTGRSRPGLGPTCRPGSDDRRIAGDATPDLADVGVGPHPRPWPDDPRLDPTCSSTATGATSSTATGTGRWRRSSPTSTPAGTNSRSRSRTGSTT